MFTGKTTELIRRLTHAQHAGHAVLAVKSHLDDRYHPTALATHDGSTLPARTVSTPADLPRLQAETAADVVGLDEAHFYRNGLHDAVMTLLDRGCRVVLAGLDRTSLNEPFGEITALLVEADEVTKLLGVCSVCGEPAPHTVRLFQSEEDVVIGGEGMFENRCRIHLHARPEHPPHG